MPRPPKLPACNLSMANFPVVVPWQALEDTMKKADLKEFGKWLDGQTVTPYGVWPDDLERFLNKKRHDRITGVKR